MSIGGVKDDDNPLRGFVNRNAYWIVSNVPVRDNRMRMELSLIIAIAVLVPVAGLVLGIVALQRTSRIRNLEMRLAGVEAALRRIMEQRGEIPPPVVTPVGAEPVLARPPEPAPPPEIAPEPEPAPELVAPGPPAPEMSLESIIGQRWLGWIAIVLILCAAAFFLKYAFENRWIGELGRVVLGIVVGLAFTAAGYDRHRKDWRYLRDVLTGGGVTILYLSIYGAFAYYHLIDQSTAFLFLAIIVVEGHLLALTYRARSIAVMALIGGYLVPVLLSTGHDQYVVLFTYITLLDIGVLGVVLARRWRWIGSLAYFGTQILFWGWYAEHYHPEKRAAALAFQAVIFLLFILADLAPHFRQEAASAEEFIRLAVNPFVFYATCYGLLNDDYHEWMAALALAMAATYAVLAQIERTLRPGDRRMLLVTIGTALTFVTLAIPVQLESNWITIAWSVEAVALLWTGFETGSGALRALSGVVFGLALGRYVIADIPWERRAPFTPVFNRYFMGTLALVACLGAAAYLYSKYKGAGLVPRGALTAGLAAFAVLWIGSSVEAFTYFSSQADAAVAQRLPDAATTSRQLRWAGELALSLLWSLYAALVTAAGFRLDLRGLRVAGLALFGITLVKVVLVDISELQQFYRIVALLALGLVLLAVAWAYQRTVRREEAG